MEMKAINLAVVLLCLSPIQSTVADSVRGANIRYPDDYHQNRHLKEKKASKYYSKDATETLWPTSGKSSKYSHPDYYWTSEDIHEYEEGDHDDSEEERDVDEGGHYNVYDYEDYSYDYSYDYDYDTTSPPKSAKKEKSKQGKKKEKTEGSGSKKGDYDYDSKKESNKGKKKSEGGGKKSDKKLKNSMKKSHKADKTKKSKLVKGEGKGGKSMGKEKGTKKSKDPKSSGGGYSYSSAIPPPGDSPSADFPPRPQPSRDDYPVIKMYWALLNRPEGCVSSCDFVDFFNQTTSSSILHGTSAVPNAVHGQVTLASSVYHTDLSLDTNGTNTLDAAYFMSNGQLGAIGLSNMNGPLYLAIRETSVPASSDTDILFQQLGDYDADGEWIQYAYWGENESGPMPVYDWNTHQVIDGAEALLNRQNDAFQGILQTFVEPLSTE